MNLCYFKLVFIVLVWFLVYVSLLINLKYELETCEMSALTAITVHRHTASYVVLSHQLALIHCYVLHHENSHLPNLPRPIISSVRDFALMRKPVKKKRWNHQKSWWFLPLITLLTAWLVLKVYIICGEVNQKTIHR